MINRRLKSNFIILLIGCFFTSGYQINFNLPPQEVEQKIQNFIQENNISTEKLFYFYSLAGRNFNKRNFSDLALKYYELALKEKSDNLDHMIQSFSEYLQLLEKEKKFNVLKYKVLDLEKILTESGYFTSNPDYQYVIDYFKVISSQDTVKNSINKDYKHFEESLFYSIILNYEFEIRMKKGLFIEAYQMFELRDQKMTQVELRSAHDLLAYILKKDPVKWHCEDSLKEFSESDSLSIKICRALDEKKIQ